MSISKRVLLVTSFILIVIFFSACNSSGGSKQSPLDPDKPVTVTLWHYYSGHNKENFDTIVEKFNETIGMEKGIVVEALSQGDVQQLADAVYSSANKGLGADPMPDIFAAYGDNAFRVNQVTPLITLDTYFSPEELSSYRKEFLEEGNFLEDGKYRILPIAKSTENLYVNKTFWDKFAKETGATTENLATWEGLAKTAENYYNHTGNGFFGIDAKANFMLLGSIQNGEELFSYEGENGSVSLNFPKEYGKKIWDYIYKPYIKGYYIKQGRFSSDDAKTGKIMAYTGSTAGAAYFPNEVTFNEKEIVSIEPMTLPYPYFDKGDQYVIQQGAGMCIAKSDLEHEYAAAEFLKWFTMPEQNLQFAVSTGYLPVKNEALEEDVLLGYLEEAGIKIPSIVSSVKTSAQMLKTHTLYNSKPFAGSYDMRNLMENHLINKIQRDLEFIEEEMLKGKDKKDIIEKISSDEEFLIWFEDFNNQADKILN
jgi:multiple sugar transport system substrate-binding protein